MLGCHAMDHLVFARGRAWIISVSLAGPICFGQVCHNSAQNISFISHVTMSLATAYHASFFVKARIEGKYGNKCVRIPFNQSTGTKESLVNTVLDLYLLPDDKPAFADDYIIDLLDISDETWSIEMSSNVDLQLAMGDFLTKSARYLPILVKVRKKTDPLIATFDDAGGLAPEVTSNALHPSASSPFTDTRIVSPLRNPAVPKRRRIAGSTGVGVGRSGRGNGGESVRARIIGSMAELRALGKPNPPRIEVALFAGYSNAASKGFSNPLSSLKTEGIVSYPDKKSVSLTSNGLNTLEAKTVVPPKDNGEVQARLKALLRPKQVEIFDFLADGKAHLRANVAAAVGYTNPASKGYVNSVGKMSSLGIVCYPIDNANPKRKWVQLTDMCFPFSKTSFTGDQAAPGINLPTFQPPTLPLPSHAPPATTITMAKIEQPNAYYSNQGSCNGAKVDADSSESDVEVLEDHIGDRIAKYFDGKLYLGSVTKHGENKGNEVFWIKYDDGDEESMSRPALDSALSLYRVEGAEVDTRKPPATDSI